jgi:hypothetical protein
MRVTPLAGPILKMIPADADELLAELILHPHPCDAECPCWKLREVPEIEQDIHKLHELRDGL